MWFHCATSSSPSLFVRPCSGVIDPVSKDRGVSLSVPMIRWTEQILTLTDCFLALSLTRIFFQQQAHDGEGLSRLVHFFLERMNSHVEIDANIFRAPYTNKLLVKPAISSNISNPRFQGPKWWMRKLLSRPNFAFRDAFWQGYCCLTCQIGQFWGMPSLRCDRRYCSIG